MSFDAGKDAGRPLTATRLEVPGGLDASGRARRELLTRSSWPSERMRDDVALVLSEVVTNAVVHGGMGPGTQKREGECTRVWFEAAA